MNLLLSARLPLVVIGALIFFAAERYGSDAMSIWALDGIGFFLVLLAIGISFGHSRSSRANGFVNEAKAFQVVMIWKLMILLGLGTYALYRFTLGDRLEPENLGEKALLACWLCFLVIGFFGAIGFELGLRGTGKGRNVDLYKLLRGGESWLSIGLLFCSLFALNYWASQKDQIHDLSYLKVTQPSDSSINMVKSLDKEMTIAMFYPTTNDVQPFVDEYFSHLVSSESKVKLKRYDKELHPKAAEDFKVSKNGRVVLRVGTQRKSINIGLELKKTTRKNLKKLDEKFQKAFLGLTAKKKIAYITRSHGEMEAGGNQSSPLRKLRAFEYLLKNQNFSIKKLDRKNGLLSKIPEDATLLVIPGPTQAFLQEEVAVIHEFVESGGALLVLLDNDDVLDEDLMVQEVRPLIEQLKKYGITYIDHMLANDKKHITNTRTKVDRWFLHTSIFGSHKATENLSKYDRRLLVLFYQSGYLTLANEDGWKTTATIKSLKSTYPDINRNQAMDKGERQSAYPFAAVAEKKHKGKDLRVMVVADANSFSDPVLKNPGNQIMILDSIRWLSGDESIAVEQSSEEDVQIVHSRDKHLYVFYGTIVMVPAAVLGLGFVATRRRSSGRGER